MKKYALFFVAIGSSFSFSCFAQQSDLNLIANNDLAIVSYHVEERVNMNFGSSITTYDVPSLELVNTNNLGGNNTRVITPKYAKVRAKSLAIEIAKNDTPIVLLKVPVTDEKAIKMIAPTEAKRDYVNIDVVGTYERIMDKGYKSVDMIVKVADRHFFDGDLVLAAKWYTELFDNTTKDIEAVYYYRYGQSLIAIGQIEKGNAMMKLFESKSL